MGTDRPVPPAPKPANTPSNLEEAKKCAVEEKKWRDLKKAFLSAAMEDAGHVANASAPVKPYMGGTVPALPQSALGTTKPELQVGQESLHGGDEPDSGIPAAPLVKLHRECPT